MVHSLVANMNVKQDAITFDMKWEYMVYIPLYIEEESNGKQEVKPVSGE